MTTIDRPEDVANRNYYNNEMLVRPVRVTVEMDVEWRDGDPDYCLEVAKLDGRPSSGVRVLHPRVVSAEYVGDETTVRQVHDGG